MKLMDRFQRWQRYQRYRRMVRELCDYGNNELAELGIARTDIERVAYDAVYGAPPR